MADKQGREIWTSVRTLNMDELTLQNRRYTLDPPAQTGS